MEFTTDLTRFAASGLNRPYLEWLVRLPIADKCMFCTHPVGTTHIVYANIFVDPANRYGYLTCETCKADAIAVIDEIRADTTAKIAHALFKTISVKRSSGMIEHDWTIMMSDGAPQIVIEHDLTIRIWVMQSSAVSKRVTLHDFLELNPKPLN